MDELAKRLAELSPERRAEFVRLAKARTQSSSPVSEAKEPNAPVEQLLDIAPPIESSAHKREWKQFYDTVSAHLNASVFGEFSYFLNYGYLPDGSPEFAAVQLPAQFLNKNSVKLVLELIGDCPVKGKRVLDVGCGRGGTIYTFKTFFQPATLTGLDLSATAIAFDRKAHGDSRTTFVEGDAENLPFPDGSFDIVTNVESSHSYPSIHRFYAEVRRVLVPGGYFLYTDALSPQRLVSGLAHLDYLGFVLERNRNITRNVLLSCDEISTSRLQAFDGQNDQRLIENFLATPGSSVYENLRSGLWEYRIYKLKKRV